jgi:hypothetical protein
MAENESLDLSDPGGQRWRHVLDAVRKRKTPEEIARQVQLKLPKSLRKAFKEFLEKGVSFEQMLASRSDQKTLQQLARKCGSHEYANLFAETAAISVGKSDYELMTSYLNGVVGRFVDQITHRVVGREWASIPDVQAMFRDVQRITRSDTQRLAEKLSKDPTWNPTVKPRKKQDKAAATKDLLGVSMLGDKR